MQEKFSNTPQENPSPSEEKIKDVAEKLVFVGFEDLRYREGESEQLLYTQITEGYAKALQSIKDELGYDLSDLEVKFDCSDVRSLSTVISMSATDYEGNVHRFGDAQYKCGESTPDGRGIQGENTVNPDKLATKIFTALSQDREFLRLNTT